MQQPKNYSRPPVIYRIVVQGRYQEIRRNKLEGDVDERNAITVVYEMIRGIRVTTVGVGGSTDREITEDGAVRTVRTRWITR